MKPAAVATIAFLAGAYGTLRGVEWLFGWYVRQACRPQGRVLP